MIKIMSLILALTGFSYFSTKTQFITHEVNIVDLKGRSVVRTKKVVYLTDMIDRKSLTDFFSQMKQVKEISGPLLIVIDSPGGEVPSGALMLSGLNAFKMQTGEKVICYVKGQAASMAFNILSFCDVKIGDPRAVYLIHKVAYSFLDGMGEERLTAKTLRKYADLIEKDDEPYRRQNAKELHFTLKEYDLLADNDTVFTSAYLLERFYLDKIATLE